MAQHTAPGTGTMKNSIIIPSCLLTLMLGAVPAASQAPAISEDLSSLMAAVAASDLKGLARWEAFRPRFEALVERAPASAEALEALLIMLEETRFERRRGTMPASAGALLARILEYHADSPRLVEMARLQRVLAPELRRATFVQLGEHSPHPEVQAAVLFALGRGDFFSRDPELSAGGAELLSDVYDRYGKLPHRGTTYGALIDAWFSPYPSERLAVGQPAPEIAGRTHAGKEMTLSSLRGKVVLLAFWGNW